MSTQTPIIGVVSGKGGVGKTNLVANVGVAAAQRGARVLAVDGEPTSLAGAYATLKVLQRERRLAADLLEPTTRSCPEPSVALPVEG